jgi:dynein heavy chain 2
MSVPDSTQIAAVMLASEGFATAAHLAGKVTTLFSLAAEGLTRQQHYDWGLRALKTMLGTAGRLLRQVGACCPGRHLTGYCHDSLPPCGMLAWCKAGHW